MKKLFLSLSLSIIFLNSCVSKVVSDKKPYTDERISIGKTYTFISNNGTKKVFTVQKIDASTIVGTNYEGKEISIEKSEISRINKSNTLSSVGLAATIIVVVLFVPAYIKNEPVGGR